jgi:hypothetical protein
MRSAYLRAEELILSGELFFSYLLPGQHSTSLTSDVCPSQFGVRPGKWGEKSCPCVCYRISQRSSALSGFKVTLFRQCGVSGLMVSGLRDMVTVFSVR